MDSCSTAVSRPEPSRVLRPYTRWPETMVACTTSRDRPTSSRASALRTTSTAGSVAAAATSLARMCAVPIRNVPRASAPAMASEVQQVSAEAAVAVACPQQSPAAEHRCQPVQHAVNGGRVHEAGEEEPVAAHCGPGFLEVIRDFLGGADDAVTGTAAAGLQDLPQGGPRRSGLGEMFEGAPVAVGAEFGKGRVEVEPLEVDDGQVGDGVELAVDVPLRELPPGSPQLFRFGPGAGHGG